MNRIYTRPDFLGFIFFVCLPFVSVLKDIYDGGSLSNLFLIFILLFVYDIFFYKQIEDSLEFLNKKNQLNILEKSYLKILNYSYKLLSVVNSFFDTLPSIFKSIVILLVLILVIGGILGLLVFGWKQLF